MLLTCGEAGSTTDAAGRELIPASFSGVLASETESEELVNFSVNQNQEWQIN